MDQLISAWRRFDTKKPPYVLPGDEAINSKFPRPFTGWPDFHENHEFAPGESPIHLGLLPIPFVGNLKKASVFLLMLNPGFGPHDYFGEYQVPEFRSALVNNLCQTRDNSFFYLDPRFSWHGGFNYWHSKLRSTIAAYAEKSSISYRQAREFFRSKIAVVQLMPYHSASFNVSSRVLNKMKSVQLARNFLHDELLPRAKSGDCLIIITRAVKHWELPTTSKNVVTYTSSEPRSAHLGPNSRGGSAILQFFRGRRRSR